MSTLRLALSYDYSILCVLFMPIFIVYQIYQCAALLKYYQSYCTCTGTST